MHDNNDIILKVNNLKQHFVTGTGQYKIYNKAVDGISFEVKKGEVFSLVGESGCGKTTTGRTIMKIYEPTDGEVFLLGKRIAAGTKGLARDFKRYKKEVKREIKRISKDDKLNSDEQKSKITKLLEELSIRRIEVKKEIKERLIDQRSKYRPSKEELNEVKLAASKKIIEYEELIRSENEKFLIFKKTAFEKSDSLSPNVSKEERDRIHDKELAKYREIRKTKNDKVLEYKHEIIRWQTSPKFFNRPIHNQIQMVFQDPIDSLNPRMNVKDIIAESLYINGIRNDKIVLDKVYEVLELVGLHPSHADHYPHEFSGGQRQRIGIARAIISEPQVIIADEPISALDVSIQAQVINLLNELREKLGLTIIFIAHDLSVVKFLSDRVAIMYFGKIVEMGSKDKIFNHPLHPYTKSLISSIPIPDPTYERSRGENIKYDPRVHDYSVDKPELRQIEDDHYVYANEIEFTNYLKDLKAKKA